MCEHLIMFYVYAACTCNKDKMISYKNFLIACTNDALQQLDRYNYYYYNNQVARSDCTSGRKVAPRAKKIIKSKAENSLIFLLKFIANSTRVKF